MQSQILTENRYYINEKDQIRQIANPDQEFNFFISKNERVRETQREAMDSKPLQHHQPPHQALY